MARFISNHPTEEKQIAFYGGSFTALSADYRASLLFRIRQVMDQKSSFRISTHPLYINPEILAECRHQGISCIELGIQDFDSHVLLASSRGYDNAIALAASRMVKAEGFTLGIQLMPGLPGSDSLSISTNMRCLRQLKPDYLRLYPLIVIDGTPLARLYTEGQYLPLQMEEAVKLCADYAELADSEGISIIKMGLPSNLSPEDVLAGPYHPAFGEFVLAERLIRKIMLALQLDKEIKLDKKQQALIMAHKGKYRVILEERLKTCFNGREVNIPGLTEPKR